MTKIHLTNSASHRKERFVPHDPADVRMYVCGPTVYDRAHLGNARPSVVFDMLYRLLRHVYGETAVTYVRNFTDVDDRINETAKARKAAGAAESLEALIATRSDETIDWYLGDMDALGIARPDHMPRATQYIAPMVAMIADLIKRGFAYPVEGHVLFRVDSYAQYGALSGRSVDDMIAGARVEVAPYKENPMDFVLWKPSSDDLPGWDSPWGRGRPGWHIECSAMARDLLGDSFDIHGGGNDLLFPHHENEIAQSRACGHGFARYWLHNEMLQVEGKKMSKSLGNFFTVRDLLDRGIPGEVIRYVLLSTHYRKPMNWTEEKSRQAYSRLNGWRRLLEHGLTVRLSDAQVTGFVDERVIEALSDDLNTHAALQRLGVLESEAKSSEPDSDAFKTFAASVRFMGFGDIALKDHNMGGNEEQADHSTQLRALEMKLMQQRALALETKDFSALDAMKAALIAAGFEVRMSKAGVALEPKPGADLSGLEDLL